MRNKEKSHAVQQHFYGSASNVAGRDLHQRIGSQNVNVAGGNIVDNRNTTSLADILEVIRNIVEQTPEIPEVQKPTILGHVKSLLSNPYVVGIVSGEIVETIKHLLS